MGVQTGFDILILILSVGLIPNFLVKNFNIWEIFVDVKPILYIEREKKIYIILYTYYIDMLFMSNVHTYYIILLLNIKSLYFYIKYSHYFLRMKRWWWKWSYPNYCLLFHWKRSLSNDSFLGFFLLVTNVDVILSWCLTISFHSKINIWIVNSHAFRKKNHKEYLFL